MLWKPSEDAVPFEFVFLGLLLVGASICVGGAALMAHFRLTVAL